MTISYHSGERIQATSEDFAGTPAISGGWKEVGRTTLGSAGDTISVASLPDKRYYMILGDVQATGGQIVNHVRANSDTSANYAGRRSRDGGADATEINTNRFFTAHDSKSVVGRFIQGNISNKADKEKLGIFNVAEIQNASASYPPARIEGVGKHSQTSSALNELSLYNDESGSFATGSELVVLGWDETDTHSTNFWEELASVDLSGGAATNIDSGTITAKKYLWIQYYTEQSVDSDFLITFNADTGSNYARRYSNDGGSDITGTSLTSFKQVSRTANLPQFTNMFIINNSANEKLIMTHTVYRNTAGAGTAPQRWEAVGKWANTSAQITAINVKSGSGNLASKTTMKVWGSD